MTKPTEEAARIDRAETFHAEYKARRGVNLRLFEVRQEVREIAA